MVHINLLPVRQIKQTIKAKNELTALFVALFILLSAFGTIFFFQASKTNQLNADIAELNRKKQSYDKTIAEIKKLEQQEATFKKQIGIIRKLENSSALTVHILDEVANLTPSDRMWLRSLKQSGQNLSISGMALDNRTIAQYMEDLKVSGYITRVNLVNSSLKEYAGRNLKSFSLSCSISPDTKKDTK